MSENKAEGLKQYYSINKNKKDPNNKSDHDNIKWTITINEGANGYRLPTEAEWEYAAGGGQASESYTYSGNNNADEVAWYWKNAGDKYLSGDWNWPKIESNKNKTKSVGSKQPNELGLYDMSGNVSGTGTQKIWMDRRRQEQRDISFRGKFEGNGFVPHQGFRVVRGE